MKRPSLAVNLNTHFLDRPTGAPRESWTAVMLMALAAHDAFESPSRIGANATGNTPGSLRRTGRLQGAVLRSWTAVLSPVQSARAGVDGHCRRQAGGEPTSVLRSYKITAGQHARRAVVSPLTLTLSSGQSRHGQRPTMRCSQHQLRRVFCAGWLGRGAVASANSIGTWSTAPMSFELISRKSIQS